MSWSSAQYLKFDDERSRAARDLVAAIPEGAVATAADIGCGPGNSTEILARRFPRAMITGLDSSPDMLASARRRLPTMTFELGDIARWDPPSAFDVVLSNAALQWLPDHERLFPRLLAQVARGGHLAVQMPDNLDAPSHRLMREIAVDGPWAGVLADASKVRAARHDAGWYYRLLRPHAGRVDIWRTTYHHPLAGAAAVVEWLKGSGLRPFLDPLGDADRTTFLTRYEAGVAAAYPALPDGTVLLPFPRLFVLARR